MTKASSLRIDRVDWILRFLILRFLKKLGLSIVQVTNVYFMSLSGFVKFPGEKQKLGKKTKFILLFALGLQTSVSFFLALLLGKNIDGKFGNLGNLNRTLLPCLGTTAVFFSSTIIWSSEGALRLLTAEMKNNGTITKETVNRTVAQ